MVINNILTWSENSVTSSATEKTKFAMTDTTFDVPVVTLSTQDNAKMLEQFSSDFKTTINWNKYQSKVSTERQSKYLDLLIDPTFQGVDRIFFFLLFENEISRKVHKRYYPPNVEIKDSNVMTDGKNFSD